MTTDKQELDEILNLLYAHCGSDHGSYKYDIPIGNKEAVKNQLRRLLRQVRKDAAREAVDSELNRLIGALEIMQLCEADMNIMLTWVKNAKWAVIAPEGEDLQAEKDKEADR